MAEKKIPLRKCIGCGEMKPKKELIRVVKSKDGEIQYDPTGKMPGRGAYLCAAKECFDRLAKVKGFERAFKCSIPPEVFSAVNEKIGE